MARGHDEVKSHSLADGETFDDSGYALVVDDNGDLRAVSDVDDGATGTPDDLEGEHAFFGVNYVSTENQKEEVVYPASGEIDTVLDTVGFPVKVDAGTYQRGESAYLSGTNLGQFNNSDTANVLVGTFMENKTTEEDGEKVLMAFSIN